MTATDPAKIKSKQWLWIEDEFLVLVGTVIFSKIGKHGHAKTCIYGKKLTGENWQHTYTGTQSVVVVVPVQKKFTIIDVDDSFIYCLNEKKNQVSIPRGTFVWNREHDCLHIKEFNCGDNQFIVIDKSEKEKK